MKLDIFLLLEFNMGTQKTVTIKVNHMIWVICNPYFSFPSYVSRILSKYGTVWKCSYIHKINLAIHEGFFKFKPTLG